MRSVTMAEDAGLAVMRFATPVDGVPRSCRRAPASEHGATQAELLVIAGLLVLAIIVSFRLFGPQIERAAQNVGTCIVHAVSGDFSACGPGAGGTPTAGAGPPAVPPPGPGTPPAPPGGGQTWGQWLWGGIKNGAQWAWDGTFGPTVKDIKDAWNGLSNWWTNTGRPWVVWAWNGTRPWLVWVWDGTRWLLWDNQIAQWVWSPVTDTWSGLKDDWNWARDKFTEWRRDPRGWGQYLWDGTKWVLVGVWDTTKDLIVNNPVTDAASGTWQFVKGAWVWVTGGSGGGAQGSGLPAGGRI